jgi:hypothetical protein
MLCKNFRQKYSKIKKLVTCTPVSTNGTFSAIPKSVLPVEKKKKISDSYFGGLREYYIQKWLKNSKKIPWYLVG